MGVCIGITSGKGGVGKSSVCIGLAYALSKKDYKVCLVDMDLGLKNLDIMLGLENRVFYDISDVALAKCSLSQALIKSKNTDNIHLLCGCKSIHIEKINQQMFIKIIDELKDKFDYILFDTAAGIESGFKYTIQLVDQILVVSTLDSTSLQDADRIIGLLMRDNIENIKCIINRYNPRHIDKGISIQLKNALEYLSIECIGIIYEDEQIIRGNNLGYPIVFNENSKVYECFNRVVDGLLGNEIILPKHNKSILKWFFSS